ncbi:MAG: hypothetical protein HY925_02125, partial [Elusimicrobia bacterium]|nr:hypothetical protein [Elusimicrobiota bacterium]
MTKTLFGVLAAALATGAWAASPETTLQGDSNVKVCNADTASIAVTASPSEVYPGGRLTLSWEAANEAGFEVTDAGHVNGNSAQVTAPSTPGTKTYTVTTQMECGQASGSVTVTIKQKAKVFLSGSRFYTPPSVGDYMLTYTIDPNFGSAEGASVNGLVQAAASAGDKARFNDYADKMRQWPQSAQAYNYSHTAGRTYIVDESGSVLGDLDTWGLFNNGLPGLNYLGNPWGNGDYNKVFVGNGSLNFNGIDYDVVGFVSVSPIILDLDLNGMPDGDKGQWLPHPARFNKSRSVLFDINADGFPDVTEWIGPGDGILVAPVKKAQGVKGENLFGNPIGFMDGYQKLGMRFDKDQDGRISGDELSGLL